MKTKLLSLLWKLHKTQPDLMKVPINSTSLCFDLANYLYAELDFGVLMINNGLDEGCGVDAYHMCAKTAHHMHTYILHHVRENCVLYTSNTCLSYARHSRFLHFNSMIFCLHLTYYLYICMRPGPKHEFVKTVTSCKCVLCGQSMGMCAGV